VKKLVISLFSIILVFVLIFFLNSFSSNGKNNEARKNEVSNASVEASSKAVEEDEAFTREAKQLIAEQFEYFHSLINSDFFYQSRMNKAEGSLSEDWVTNQVKEELHTKAVEIDNLLPEELDSSNSLSQDLLQVLIRMNQASSSVDSQRNIYHIYKILYEHHVDLNQYEFEEVASNGRENFNPEVDWEEIFPETEEQTVKTEAELQEEIEKGIEDVAPSDEAE